MKHWNKPAIALIHSTPLLRIQGSQNGAQDASASPPLQEEDLFPHNLDRFRVIRKLGSGGMGTVYEVFDNVLSSRVAAKTLRRATGTGITLFKREFRSLANIHHPNLVTLYEFF